MSIRAEVVPKIISKPRLTITKDRVTLKIPIHISETMKYRLIIFSEQIHKVLWNEEMISRRGSFDMTSEGKLNIDMSVGKSKQDKIYFEEE